LSGIAAAKTTDLNLAKHHRAGWLVGVDWPMVADSSTRAPHRGFAILFTSVALYSETTERSSGLEDLHSTIANCSGSGLLASPRAQKKLGDKRNSDFFWCLIILCVNSLSFDLRDIPGDLRLGTRTAAVLLDANWSVVFLGALALLATLMSPLLGLRGAAGVLVPSSLIVGVGLIFWAFFSHVEPITFSFVADLLFFLPALALLVAR
jgi:hypothetical protein